MFLGILGAVLMHRGACLCGAVTFTVSVELDDPDTFHSDGCRKWTGLYLVSSYIALSNVRIEGEKNTSLYQSSGKVRRGFCKTYTRKDRHAYNSEPKGRLI
jgi:hypothetical protein